jgi:hypothetical protein
MSQYTRGPWMVEKRELKTDAGDDSPGSHGSQTHLIWSNPESVSMDATVLAHIVIDNEVGMSEANTNAELISFAPELLALVRSQVIGGGALRGQVSPALREFLEMAGPTRA